MKLKNELPNAIALISENLPKYRRHAAQLKLRPDEYNDFTTRFVWDVIRHAYTKREPEGGILCHLSDLYDQYDCTDAHIETLARAACKEMGLI